ncbi:hypothetical protein EUGRSUZ_C02649 [Eucalyptus grandis]|uniref:Uncharacterized protein n=1 Tax=Eucalyptus grandis TaxID=71139 RepID=A0ACC3LGT6_EUCGR|nr:hypothetical protein EUGRSUZ_C02649 [Eucalyptus grandis]
MASAVGAAGMKRKRAESSSTSSPSSEINYEVFLNFRGPDTRKGFTDHLHDRLRGAGIRVFRDEEDLPAGQEIKPELRKAIKRSRISIAILSKNYSQSEHCLMELVQMWECSKSRKHTIIPIFYDVSPSDVKDQDGVFIRSIDQLATKGAKAFTITYWKKVLGKIGDIRGYERTNVKGNIAAFMERKVLIVLDNVCTIKQIEALAGKFAWFGLGSRIIMTTRKKNFVKDFDFEEEDEDREAEEYEVNPLGEDREAEEYEVNPLGDHHALELFRMHAFRGGAYPDASEYVSYSRDIVEALQGHPMAIVLWAKYLKKKNIERWGIIRDSLRENTSENPSEGDVKAPLKAIYDSLNTDIQEIFLDIACFFLGMDWKIPSYMWKACGRHPLIPDLCDMYLLEIGKKNELRMHDLVKGFGRELVKYWNQSAALPIPEDFQKVEKLKVLNLQGCRKLHESLDFPAPINLEILILFINGLENLSSLILRNCRRVKKLPLELAQMKFLKELLIDGTGIKVIYIRKGSLQYLNKLSACGCEKLKDISTISCLESLTSLALDGAKKVRAPKTFEFPQKLQRLSLRECAGGGLEVMDLSSTGITELPESVKELRNLKTLKMEHTHLQKFPEYIVKLEKLEEIDFSGCISLGGQVPCDISVLSCLRILRLAFAFTLASKSLTSFNAQPTSRTTSVGPPVYSVSAGDPETWEVPDLSYLTNLKELCLNDDEQPRKGGHRVRPPNVEWITRLPSLETLQIVRFKGHPISLGNFSALTQLRELSLSYMKELDLSQLPSSSLLTLRLKYCKIPEPTFSSLQHHLSELELEYCELAEIDGLKDLNRLVVLTLSHCKGVTNLNGLKDLRRLRKVKGIFEDRPSLPKLSKRVKQDIYPEA